ncbi:MAG: hypothetical protein RBU30_04385 [Polyangia bacterium]|nr:hypothetical protein [Polyangia bacterium]
MLDAGNLFVYGRELNPQQQTNPEIMKKAAARADLIAEVYGRLGAQGMAVGGSDLALGLATLRSLAQKHRIPLLSANLQDGAGRRIFPASRMVKAGNVSFGVFGLTAFHPRWQGLAKDGKFKLGDAMAAAKTEAAALRAKGAQIVIMLAAIGNTEARRIARELTDIDLVFISGTGMHMPNPERQGSAFLVETAREGKYIGHMTLHIRQGKLKFEDLSERYALAENIKGMQKTLDSLQKHMPPDVAESRREWMANRISQTERSLASTKQRLHVANQIVPKESFLVSFMAPATLTMQADPAIAELINARAKAAGLQRPPGSH